MRESFNKAIEWINSQPKDNFNKEMIPGKWTIAGHLYHLIKSTKAVSKGMKMSKIVLKTMFGKNNRQERTYQETLEKYESILTNTNLKAPSSYEAEQGRIFERLALIERFKGELNDLIKAMEKWEEADMGVYIMPHPALGKCTVREFIYFTIFHTDHHLRVLEENYSDIT